MLPLEKSPHDEIRFTRNGQSVPFFLVALGLLCLGVALLLLSVRWSENTLPVVEKAWYGLLPLSLGIALGWWAVRLVKHAFLIFTPLGIELFPFWFPAQHSGWRFGFIPFP